MFPFDTVDTTRVSTDSAIEMSIAVSRMQWPNPGMKKTPNVVILVPTEEFSFAFAASSLVHDPIMGTILFSPLGELPDITRDEIKRLKPPGTELVPPVITVGPFNENVIHQIEALGYAVLPIKGKTVFSTAVKVLKLREKITPMSEDGPVSLFIVSADIPYEGVVAPYYATHSGVPILLTHKDHLPQTTAKALEERQEKNVYIVGSKHSVSEAVLQEITSIVKPPVRRIAGNDPFKTAVQFAKFYDPTTKLGWNRNKKGRGDAFTFGNLARWDLMIAASSFAHQGKHTPLLLVEDDALPSIVTAYIMYLKPALRMPPMPPFMHGFILGTLKTIDFHVQSNIEEALKLDEQ